VNDELAGAFGSTADRDLVHVARQELAGDHSRASLLRNDDDGVSDGQTLWVYMPENNQVIQSNVDFTREAQAEDPMTFLTGLGNLTRDFSISWAEPNRDHEGNYVLQLRPRRVSAPSQAMCSPAH